MENITLYEAMKIINDYIEEKAHNVIDNEGKEEVVHGTAARIAKAKAAEEVNNIKNANKLKDIAKATYKGALHNANASDLSKGATKEYKVADAKAEKLNKEVAKKFNNQIKYAENKKYVDKKLNKLAADAGEADDKFYDKRHELRDLKKKYMATESAKSDAIIAGIGAVGTGLYAKEVKDYLKKIDDVKRQISDEEAKENPNTDKIVDLKLKLKKLKSSANFNKVMTALMAGSTASEVKHLMNDKEVKDATNKVKDKLNETGKKLNSKIKDASARASKTGSEYISLGKAAVNSAKEEVKKD